MKEGAALIIMVSAAPFAVFWGMQRWPSPLGKVAERSEVG